jgi:hypothetical protein
MVASLSNIQPSVDRQTFTLSAKSPGKAMLNGKEPKANNDFVFPLLVVVGECTKHPGMAVDLLADKLGKSSDPYVLYQLQRLLNNNHHDDTNLFDQHAPRYVKRYRTNLACGDVAKDSGKALFGDVSLVYSSYHKPTRRVNSRDDIHYEHATIDRARSAIKARLERGIPVRVGTAHGFSENMLKGTTALQPDTTGGHFCLIVGSNHAADLFLYVDPWWGGSVLKYEGGMQTLNPSIAKCEFLGLFELQKTTNRGPVLIQRADTEGTFKGTKRLEVIAGPL